MRLSVVLTSLSFGLVACGGPPPTAPEGEQHSPSAELVGEAVVPGSAAAPAVAGAPAYRDVEEGFDNEVDQDRWWQLKRRLRQDFDEVCGDTFCEGDFSNLQAMSFRCSQSVRTGQLKSCLWLFAGSYENVTPSTGTIRPVARWFQCKLAVQGSANDFAKALLAGPEAAIRMPLPGQTRSIYDTLIDCL